MPENDTSWGSDARVSMPEPVDGEDVLVDFGSHVFTPGGMRLKMTGAVRDEIISNSFSPVDGGDG